MAFKTKTDYYNLAITNKLILTDTAEGKTSQTATAQGEDGFIVAEEVFGTYEAPSENLTIVADLAAGDLSPVLGKVNTVGTKKYVLSGFSITTGAGQQPTVSASGREVNAAATDGCKCTVAVPAVTRLHHAQTFGAFTLSGTGAHLTQCTFQAQGQINVATKDGEVINFDFTGANITVTGTVQVSDSGYGEPTISPATGYKLTSPLSCTNPDADFPSYTFTLTKNLAADTAN